MQDRGALNVERIVAAAIALADEDGLPAVSMARVARRLGFTTMALYRHVASKDELLVLMMDRALALGPERPYSGWRQGVEQWAWDLLQVVRRHPWWLQVPISPRPTTPSTFVLMERGLRPFAGTGLPEPEKAGLMLMLNGFVMWQARLETELTDAGVAAYAESMRAVEGSPSLEAMVAAGTFEDAEDTSDEDFAWGLGILLDGVELKVRSAGRSAGSGSR